MAERLMGKRNKNMEWSEWSAIGWVGGNMSWLGENDSG